MKLTLKRNIVAISILMLITLLAIISFASKIQANQLFFGGKASGTATTSITYLQRASTIATTTNAFEVGKNNSSADKLHLAIQLTATSSNFILGWRYEFANDTPDTDCVANEAACDWYSDDIFSMSNSSTTQSVNINAPFKYTWQFSSTTDLCGGTSQTVANAGSRRCKLLAAPTPTRYIRVVFFIDPASASNIGAIYSQWISQKQVNN